jgi:hypothetical protein
MQYPQKDYQSLPYCQQVVRRKNDRHAKGTKSLTSKGSNKTMDIELDGMN